MGWGATKQAKQTIVRLLKKIKGENDPSAVAIAAAAQAAAAAAVASDAVASSRLLLCWICC